MSEGSWFTVLANKIAALIVSGLAVFGLGGSTSEFHATSTPPKVISSEMQDFATSSAATSPESEFDVLKRELAEERAARLKLEAKISGSETKKSVSPAPPPPVSKPVVSFTTPSGAVLDQAGNVLSKPEVAPSASVVETGQALSASAIVKKLAPSVARINTSEGAGSGVVINQDKYVLTNEHVVGTNSTVVVILPSMTIQSAPVLGKDKTSDLAIVYVGAQKPPSAVLGSSEDWALPIGDDVYALGFPLSITKGLTDLTFTRGILSARQKPDWSPIALLQTDAAINSGNSGGPLVNSGAEVIGINVSRPNDDSQGIYFVIPIDTAKGLIPALSQYGQSRYEIYPIGSQQNIAESKRLQIDLNRELSCNTLGFTGNDLIICGLYREHKNDYTWNVILGN